MNKKYVVRLTDEERGELSEVVKERGSASSIFETGENGSSSQGTTH